MNITQEANEMTIKDSFVVKGFKGFEPVKMVGGYKLTKDPMNKTFAKKPSKFHRICTRFFLGWVWEDSDINFYSI
jgi:hypothetical protein